MVGLLAGTILAGTWFGRGEDFPPFYVKKQGTSYGFGVGAYVKLDKTAKFYGQVIAGYCKNNGTINGAAGGVVVGNSGTMNGATGGLLIVDNSGTMNGAVGGLGVVNLGNINGGAVGGLGVANLGNINGTVGGLVIGNSGTNKDGNEIYGKFNGLEAGVLFTSAEVAPDDRLLQLGLYNSILRNGKNTRGLLFNYIGREKTE